MIRALSSEERAFFIENMIGNLLHIAGPPESSSLSSALQSSAALEREAAAAMQAALKEELCRQPYAGLFVLYMMDRFEDLTDDDFYYWDKCCQMTADTTVPRRESVKGKSILKNKNESNLEETKRSSDVTDGPAQPKYGVYKSELVLLSKSNQSRFSRFILDFYISRKDDRSKQEAIKFVECLRHLPEYEPVIEEGSEEAVMNGEEEVKFMKRDLTQAARMMEGRPAVHLVELIKYTITGNLKQFEKTVQLLSPLA